MSLLYKKSENGDSRTGTGLDLPGKDIRAKMKATSAKSMPDIRNRVEMVNYNQEFPMTSAEGKPFYITRATTSTADNPEFKEYAPGLVAFTNKKLIPNVGNYRGVSLDRSTGEQHYLPTLEGDTSPIEDAISGRISFKTLGFE